jgi:hypothetical protein
VNDKVEVNITTKHPKNMQYQFFLINNNLKEAVVEIEDVVK